MQTAITCGAASCLAKARQLSEKLNLPLLPPGEQPGEGVYLQLDEKGISLTGDGQTMRGDFTKLLPRLKPNSLNGEMIVKAARFKGETGLVALDATAGMGEDSLLLAAAGFTVYMYEYNPIIAALLADTLERASLEPALCETVRRMHLTNADSVQAMQHLDFCPDVILLDPMFPQRQKSALVKKKFQLLHLLESPCDGEEEMLNAALSAHPRKIVIKRPAKGPLLAGVKPAYVIDGKAVRYDCIVPGPKKGE